MSRGIRVLALAVALLLTVSASPAAADDPFDVPDDATITIRGDGSGHGIGMSQYGAYGAAREGPDGRAALSYRQILDFYYPRTALGEAGGTVRVWISRDDERDLVVDAVRRLTVHALAARRSWRPKVSGAKQWRVSRNRAGDSVVSYRRSGAWRTWRVVAGDVELFAGHRPLTLHTADGATRYRGRLRAVRYRRRQLTVNVVPMEQYLRGVVPAEMAASSWPQHALRAQAVAARTYAAHERDGDRHYDLCDTAACQAYRGASAEHSRSDEAVAATARQVLTHGGEIVLAMYSASNGGWTVAAEGHPYLVAQEDPYEGTSPDYYGWRRSFTSAQVERAFGLGDLTYLGIESRDGRGPRGGRVTSVRIRTAAGFDNTVTGEKFRSNLALPSSIFEITEVHPAS